MSGPALVLAYDARRELGGRSVTLDGRPAVVCGTRARFAVVVALDGSARAEYAWPTVARLLLTGGAFFSR